MDVSVYTLGVKAVKYKGERELGRKKNISDQMKPDACLTQVTEKGKRGLARRDFSDLVS